MKIRQRQVLIGLSDLVLTVRVVWNGQAIAIWKPEEQTRAHSLTSAPNPGRVVKVSCSAPSIGRSRFAATISSTSPTGFSIGVSTCREALTYLGDNDTAVLICERDLPDGDWKFVLNGFDSLPMPPNLIVTARLANDELWAEVLNLGGYNVLAQPFDPAGGLSRRLPGVA